MRKRIIVSGTRGFIGKQLQERFSDCCVLGLEEDCLNGPAWKDTLYKKIEEFNPEAIFHAGACSDTLEERVNYMMTRNYEGTKILALWCKAHNIPFIYSSSAANYGATGDYPSNLYGWSKYTAEDFVILTGGIALRYFNVYGPGEEHKGRMASMPYQSYQKYSNTQDPIGLFPGYPRRDFVYIEDVVSANVHAWKHYDALRGKYYEVGTGQARLFEEIMHFMNIPHFYYKEEDVPPGYQFYTCSDNKRWMDGWSPAFDLEEGIEIYFKRLQGSKENRK